MIDEYTLLKAKIRNLIYYYGIDTRPRKQYVHVVRNIREIAYGLSLLANDSFLTNIVNCIPKDVKNSDTEMVVSKLKIILEVEDVK